MALFGKRKQFTYPFDDQRSGMPTIDVVIGLDAQTAKRRGAKPTTTPTSALLDTGAHRSFIDADTVHKLGLIPVGRRLMRSPLVPSGSTVWVFPISITILGKHRLGPTRNVAVVPSALAAMTLIPTAQLHEERAPKIVIGRDVLSLCRFDYDGYARKIVMHLAQNTQNDGIIMIRQ